MAISYAEFLPQIIDLIDRGASISVLVRELKLRQDLSIRRYLKEDHPELYLKVVENGRANQRQPFKGRKALK